MSVLLAVVDAVADATNGPGADTVAAVVGGGALLAFVFRTLWRQENGWRLLLSEERQQSADSRADAAAARTDAAAARADAAAARADAAKAWAEVTACEDRSAVLAQTVAEMRTQLDHLQTAMLRNHPGTEV